MQHADFEWILKTRKFPSYGDRERRSATCCADSVQVPDSFRERDRRFWQIHSFVLSLSFSSVGSFLYRIPLRQVRRSRWPVDQSLFSPGKTCRGCTLAHESTSADHAVFSLCGPTCGSGSLSSFLDVVLVAPCAGDTSRCRRLSPKFTPRSALHGGPGGSHSRPMLLSILSS